jgi:CRP-like cAMP-binding protein
MILPEELEVVGFLKRLDPAHANRIAMLARLQERAPQAVLFEEGCPSAHVYFLLSGAVLLEMKAAGGPLQIQTVGAGELLGWSPLLGIGPMTATARTVTGCRLAALEVSALLQFCETDPRFGLALMRQIAVVLAERLHATRTRLLNNPPAG